MIIDASVALKWLVSEEGSDRAQALLLRIDLTGPTLLHSEVANGLRRKARRGELGDNPNLAGLADTLRRFVQTLDEVPLIGRAIGMATMLEHSVYDCVYLALAEQLGRELVTADAKFLNKVAATELAGLVVAL